MVAKFPMGKSGGPNFNDIFRGGMGGMGGNNDEVTNLRKAIEEIKLPEEAKKIVDSELNKVSKLSPSNQEYHVAINYL